MPSSSVWGDYEIYLDQVLGRGGMGTVYRGRQISLNRPVAIKTLKKELSNPDFVNRFTREAAILGRLIDAHVVQVFGAGEGDGAPFYAMEFVEGEDLASMLKAGKKFTSEEVVEIAIQVGMALRAAWRFKIVHRDIKPSNIIISHDKVVKVMDFGLAKNPEMDLTQTEMIMGTAKYISPEQATGAPVDTRADIYSLGCVLYELATGRAPFAGDSPTAVIYQHIHKAPLPPRQLNSAIPEALQGLIMRCITKRPADRYQTPDDLIADAKAIRAGVSPDERTVLLAQTAAAPDAEAFSAAPAGGKGKGALIASLSMAALVLGGAAYFVVQALGDGARPTPHAHGGPATTGSDGGGAVETPKRSFEEIDAEARSLYDGGQWEKARAMWTELRQALAPEDPRSADLAAAIARCEFRELMASAKEHEKTNRDLAISEYTRALEKLPNDPAAEHIQLTLRQLRFRKFKDEAKERMGSDWTRAAQAYDAARQQADTAADQEEMAELRDFCAKFAEALDLLRGKREYRRALELFEDLRVRPYEFERAILDRIDECNLELGKLALRRRDESEVLYKSGRAYYERGRWREAAEAFRKAAELGGKPTSDVSAYVKYAEAAVNAPPGMAFVPGGKFILGFGDKYDVAGPVQTAETEPFYIDLREVTVGEYAKFLESYRDHARCHPEEPEDKRRSGHEPDAWDPDADDPGKPVVQVDWFDAYAYAAWAGKRLPTEAEWERAAGTEPAMGADGVYPRRLYPWGDEFAKGPGPSPCQAEGMGGGIFDWTADLFRKYKDSEATELDFGRGYRVVRGGLLGSDDPRLHSRVSRRQWYKPDARKAWVGIRCAKSVE